MGSDLANGIVTLPAFIARGASPAGNPIDVYLNDDTGDDALLAEAVEMIRQPKIINAAYNEAARRCSVARDALHTLPHTPSARVAGAATGLHAYAQELSGQSALRLKSSQDSQTTRPASMVMAGAIPRSEVGSTV